MFTYQNSSLTYKCRSADNFDMDKGQSFMQNPGVKNEIIKKYIFFLLFPISN